MNFTETLEKDTKTYLKEIYDVILDHIKDKKILLSSIAIHDEQLILDFLGDEKIYVSVIIERENDDDTDLSVALKFEDLESDKTLDYYNYTEDWHKSLKVENVVKNICNEIEEWLKNWEKGENKYGKI